jgi:hypothetical protein
MIIGRRGIAVHFDLTDLRLFAAVVDRSIRIVVETSPILHVVAITARAPAPRSTEARLTGC